MTTSPEVRYAAITAAFGHPTVRPSLTGPYLIEFVGQDGPVLMGRLDGAWKDIIALMRRLNDATLEDFGAYHVSDSMGELFVPYTDTTPVMA